MGNISVSLPNDGETIDSADYNTPINTIVTLVNGNLDSDNLASNSVGTSELQADSVTTIKVADINITSEKLKSTVGFRGTTTQSIASTASPSTITTYTEVSDFGSNFDHTTGIFSAPYNGFYFFSATGAYTDVGTTFRVGLIMYKSSTIIAEDYATTGGSNHDPAMSCSACVYMAASETAYIQTYQDSGSSKSLRVPSSFSGFLIGRI